MEADIITSNLNCNNALGHTMDSLDARGRASRTNAFLACSLFGDDVFCFPVIFIIPRARDNYVLTFISLPIPPIWFNSQRVRLDLY